MLQKIRTLNNALDVRAERTATKLLPQLLSIRIDTGRDNDNNAKDIDMIATSFSFFQYKDINYLPQALQKVSHTFPVWHLSQSQTEPVCDSDGKKKIIQEFSTNFILHRHNFNGNHDRTLSQRQHLKYYKVVALLWYEVSLQLV